MNRHKISTPGEAILDSIKWLKMDEIEFAHHLGVSLNVLEGLINGTVMITQEYAKSLESVTGSPAAYWKMLNRKVFSSI